MVEKVQPFSRLSILLLGPWFLSSFVVLKENDDISLMYSVLDLVKPGIPVTLAHIVISDDICSWFNCSVIVFISLF